MEIGQQIWKLVRTDGRTDTDRQTDRQTDSYIPPQTTFAGGIIKWDLSVTEILLKLGSIIYNKTVALFVSKIY